MTRFQPTSAVDDFPQGSLPPALAIPEEYRTSAAALQNELSRALISEALEERWSGLHEKSRIYDTLSPRDLEICAGRIVRHRLAKVLALPIEFLDDDPPQRYLEHAREEAIEMMAHKLERLDDERWVNDLSGRQIPAAVESYFEKYPESRQSLDQLCHRLHDEQLAGRLTTLNFLEIQAISVAALVGYYSLDGVMGEDGSRLELRARIADHQDFLWQGAINQAQRIDRIRTGDIL